MLVLVLLAPLAPTVAAQPLPSTLPDSPPIQIPPLAPPAVIPHGPSTNSSIVFEANLGQWDIAALFKVQAQGYDAFLTRNGLVMVQTQTNHAGPESYDPHAPTAPDSTGNTTQWATRMDLVGSNPLPLVTTSAPLAYYTNYFIGNNPLEWRTNVPTYDRVTLHNVYPGIDLHYYASLDGDLKYDFIVHPGADPSQIRQQYTGHTELAINPDGSLAIHTGLGIIQQGAPLTKQADGITVSNQYALNDATLSYLVGERDVTQDLIIDPPVYSTYLGGPGYDVGYSVAVDSEGNAIVTGYTSGTTYPATVGAYDTTHNGGTFDVFVTKFTSAGSVVYWTYLGGSGGDGGHGVVLDSDGNAIVTGFTQSTNYPTTTGAYDTTSSGGQDVFVTKLNSAGSALVYSTYIGGSSTDSVYGVATDSDGNAIITGQTSGNYPTTAGAYDTTHNTAADVFVTKLNSAGSALVYSTYLGGSSADGGRGVTVDSGGNAIVTGFTQSTNYPTTTGAYDTTYGGGQDVFVTKLNSAGSALVYSTYLGGGSADGGYSVAVDSDGNAIVAGFARSTNYPTTTGAYDTTHNGAQDVFVTKLNSAGSALVYSTFLGGSVNEEAVVVTVDADGKAIVTGYTESTNYPTTTGAYDTTHNTAADVFVTKLNSAGSALVYSTYIGGSSADGGYGLAVDSDDNIIVTGFTESTNYPTTTGAYDATHNGGNDVFVLVFDRNLNPPSEPLNLEAQRGPGRGQITLEWEAPSDDDGEPLTYLIYSGTSPTNLAYRSEVYEALSFVDSGLPDDVLRYYAVQAVHSAGYSPFSEVIAGQTFAFVPPGAPTDLAIAPGPGVGQLTVTWRLPAQNSASITSFKVYRADSGDGPFSEVGTSPRGTLLFSDSDLVAGQTYHYRVSSVNALGEGDPSEPVSGQWDSAPAPPRDLTATTSGANVNLRWRAPLGDGGHPITSYTIESSLDGTFFATLGMVSGSATSHSTPACTPQCHYRVMASNLVGPSGPSNVATALPEFAELPPESIRGSTPGAGVGLRDLFPCGSGADSVNLATGQFVSSTCLLQATSPLGLDMSVVATHRSHTTDRSVLGEGWDLSLLKRVERQDSTYSFLKDGSGREDRFMAFVKVVDDGGSTQYGDGSPLTPGRRYDTSDDPTRVHTRGSADALTVTISDFTCDLPCDDSFSPYNSNPAKNGKVLIHLQSDLSDTPMTSYVNPAGAAAFDLTGFPPTWDDRIFYVVYDLYFPAGLDAGSYRGTYSYDFMGTAYASPPGFYQELAELPGGGYELRSPKGIVERFDAKGQRTSVQDAQGNVVMFSYDLLGRPLEMRDGSGRSISFQYAADGLAAINDFAGRTIGFTRDANGNLDSIRPPAGVPGSVHRFTYTAGHDLLTAKDPNGQTYLTNTYDAQGRVATQHNGLGTMTIGYQPAQSRTEVTDPNGNRVAWAYAPLARPYEPDTFRAVSKTLFTDGGVGKPASYVTSYDVNAEEEITRVTEPDGRRIDWTYDHTNADPLARGNLLRVEETAMPGSAAAPIVRTYSYEPTHQLLRSETSPLGNDATYQPPNGGSASPERYTKTYWYGVDEASQGDLNGEGQIGWPPALPIRIDEPTVNAAGAPHPLLGAGPQERSSTYQYNARGQVTQVVNPDRSYVTYDYFEEGEQSASRPLFHLERMDRHADLVPESGSGFAAMAFAPSETTSTAFFSLATGASESYTYDEAGRVASRIDGNGRTWTLEYDTLDRVVEEAGPTPGLQTSYTYDGNGNLLSVSTPNAVQQPNGSFVPDTEHPLSTDTFEYNILGQLTARLLDATRPAAAPASSQPEELADEFRYDGNGNMVLYRGHGAVTGTNPADVTVYGYDERNLVVSTTVGGRSPLLLSDNPDLADVESPLALYLHADYQLVAECPSNAEMGPTESCAQGPTGACPGGRDAAIAGRIACLPPTRYPVADDGLDLVGTLPSARMGASLVWDAARGKAYILGGAANPNTVLDEIVSYDPETQAATVVAHLPSPRWFSGAAFDGRHAYYFGGCTNRDCSVVTDEIVRFDPVSNQVTVVAHLTTPLRGIGAVWDGSRIDLFGGCGTPCTATADIWSFDPSTASLELLDAELPRPHAHMAAVWAGDRALLFGGTGVGGNEIVSFDPATGAVSTSSKTMAPARQEMSAAWDGEHAFVFGGNRQDNSGSFAEILRYTPAEDELVVMTQAMDGQTHRGSSVWTTDSALLAGGFSGPHSDTVYRFNPVEAAPTEPQGLRAEPGPVPGQNTLRWLPPASQGSTSLLSYVVYRADQEGGPYTAIGQSPAAERHFVDDTPGEAGKMVFYAVSAVNGDLEGPRSDEAYIINTAPGPVEAPVELCPGERPGIVVADNAACPPLGSCPAGSIGGVANGQSVCVSVLGCPAGMVGVLVNGAQSQAGVPTCVAVPVICPPAGCPSPGDIVCYLPEPCIHVVPGVLGAHLGADGAGVQAEIPDVAGPIVIFVPLSGLPYNPGPPIVDLNPEAPETPETDPSWLWSFSMDETPSNTTTVKAAPDVEAAPARVAWEWTPVESYNFSDEGVRLLLWLVHPENGTGISSTVNARLYSDGELVASTNPVTGVTFSVPPGSTPREYVVDLGRITATGSTLRVELDLGADPDGRLIVFDGAGFPSRLEVGDLATTTTEYDAGGRPTLVTEPNGAQTMYEYDGHGRATAVTDPAGTRYASSFDAAGRKVLSESYGRLNGLDSANVLLQRTASYFDEAGRLYRVDRAAFDPATGQTLPEGGLIPDDGQTTTLFDYDAAGRVVAVIDDNAHASTFAYDGLGNLVGRQDAAGNSIEYAYDDAGNLVNLTEVDIDAEGIELPGRSTHFVYDEQDRVVRAIDPLGRAFRFGYDARGNLAWRTDARSSEAVFDTAFGGDVNGPGNRIDYLYDASGRLLQTTRELRQGGSGDGPLLGYVNTTQEWDGNGRLVRQTDDSGHSTAYEYDRLGRLVRTGFADGTDESYEYDARGGLVAMAKPDGTIIQQVYDEAGRVVERTAGGAWPVEQAFEYDGLGRLTWARDDGSVIAFAYDSLGNQVREAQNGPVTSRSFDGVGNALTLTYPNGRVISHDFDPVNRLTEASDASGILASFGYEGASRLVSRTAGNGVESTYTYDAAEQVTQIDHGLPSLGLPFRFGYSYDGNGNRVEELLHHAPEWSKTASFDSLGRLTAFERGNVASLPSAPNPLEGILPTIAAWTLDGANEWDAVASLQDGAWWNLTRSHDATHALESITFGAAATPVSSDDNGNRLSDGEFEYSWDALDRLREVRDAATDALVASYQYDALGRRIQKDADGQTTRYVYDGTNVIEERDGSGWLLRQFVHGPATDQPILMDSGDVRLYYLQDALGSVVGLMDEDGALLEGYLYDAYGATVILQPGPSGEVTWTADDVVDSTSALDNPYAFTGQRLDAETGRYYYRARYYDTQTGSFLSRDPIGIWGDEENLGNPYTYVANDPILGTDPTGMWGLKSLVKAFRSVVSAVSSVVAKVQAIAAQSSSPIPTTGPPAPVLAQAIATSTARPATASTRLPIASTVVPDVRFPGVEIGLGKVCDSWGAGWDPISSAVCGSRELGKCEGLGCKSWQIAITLVDVAAPGPVRKGDDAAKWLGKRFLNKGDEAARLGPGIHYGPKIENQMAKRGWTKSLVQSTINEPVRTVQTRDTRYLENGARMDDPATAYYSKRGGYVVRNDRTGDIVQVSNRYDPNWRAPWD